MKPKKMEYPNTRLWAFMEALEYSQVELANALGCHHSMVFNWLWNRNSPRGKYLDPLCDLLGVYPEQLLQ